MMIKAKKKEKSLSQSKEMKRKLRQAKHFLFEFAQTTWHIDIVYWTINYIMLKRYFGFRFETTFSRSETTFKYIICLMFENEWVEKVMVSMTYGNLVLVRQRWIHSKLRKFVKSQFLPVSSRPPSYQLSARVRKLNRSHFTQKTNSMRAGNSSHAISQCFSHQLNAV